MTEQQTQLNLMALDEQAFGAVIEPHRHELQVHCYRMLGSLHDAEDMVQETFLRAWRRRETYEGRTGRASMRAWLYKIATNICLDALEKRPRRMLPVTRAAAASVDEPIPAGISDPIWLDPYPDDLLSSHDADPETYYTAREHITIAFMAALHLLPPRQRAVLILRDVLDWQADEAANLLETTVPAVKSALRRARVTLAEHRSVGALESVAPPMLDETLQMRLSQYMTAWESADVNTLLSLLKADASFSMPPIPSWYQGRETIGALVTKTIFSGDAVGRWRLVPTRANGQLAFGLYRRERDGYQSYGIQVLTMAGDWIADITTFRVPDLLTRFELPSILHGKRIKIDSD